MVPFIPKYPQVLQNLVYRNSFTYYKSAVTSGLKFIQFNSTQKYSTTVREVLHYSTACTVGSLGRQNVIIHTHGTVTVAVTLHSCERYLWDLMIRYCFSSNTSTDTIYILYLENKSEVPAREHPVSLSSLVCIWSQNRYSLYSREEIFSPFKRTVQIKQIRTETRYIPNS